MKSETTRQNSKNGLDERLKFLDLDGDAIAALQGVSGVLNTIMEPALGAFYDRIRSTPETAKMFSSDQHVNGAKSLQVKHWDRIAAGSFDDKYVEAVSKVGNAHARIGLEPRWYIGGYALLLSELIKGVVAARCKGILGAKAREALSRELPAIVKAALLDMDYAISVYLEKLAEEREAANRRKEAQDRSREEAMGQFRDVLSELAQGDLERRLGNSLPEEFSVMSHNYDEAVQALAASLRTVRSTADRTLESAQSIAATADTLSKRTEQQAASLEESSAALHELTQSVSQTSDHARNAASVVVETRSEVEESGKVMRQATESMSALAESAARIGNITAVIDDIAFQTNLLALNAGVEAARAGEAGKGFAVVAQEVRELAQRSATAAKEIAELIESSDKQVRRSVELVNKTGESLSRIVSRVESLNELAQGIASSANEQTGGLREVSTAVEHLDGITQQNAAMVQDAETAIRALAADVETLATAVQRFKTRDTQTHAINKEGPERRRLIGDRSAA